MIVAVAIPLLLTALSLSYLSGLDLEDYLDEDDIDPEEVEQFLEGQDIDTSVLSSAVDIKDAEDAKQTSDAPNDGAGAAFADPMAFGAPVSDLPNISQVLADLAEASEGNSVEEPAVNTAPDFAVAPSIADKGAEVADPMQDGAMTSDEPQPDDLTEEHVLVDYNTVDARLSSTDSGDQISDPVPQRLTVEVADLSEVQDLLLIEEDNGSTTISLEDEALTTVDAAPEDILITVAFDDTENSFVIDGFGDPATPKSSGGEQSSGLTEIEIAFVLEARGEPLAA